MAAEPYCLGQVIPSAALDLILKKKFDDALAKAMEVRTIHANWKDKPGSWYMPASLFVAECHIRKGNAAEADKVLTELRNMSLKGNFQNGLLMVMALALYLLVDRTLARLMPWAPQTLKIEN